MKYSFFLYFYHRAHFESLLKYIETGVKEGAKLVYGGKRVGDKGMSFVINRKDITNNQLEHYEVLI